MNGRTIAALVGLSSIIAWAAACTAPAAPPAGEGQTDNIVGGTTATAYPEAVLVDLYSGGQLVAACSGSLVAPKLVLTAGHCVYGYSSWKITAPFAKGQTSNATKGETYDWTASGESVDPSMHDLGLIHLSTAITLDAYPAIASSALASGASIVNVGRIQDGQLSDSALFVSKSIKVKPGSSYGFPYDYESSEIIEPGDSGGPDLLPGAAPHTIVAVNSGAGSGTEVLARVDLVASWIAGRIAAAKGGSGAKGGGTPAPSCTHDVCEAGTKLAKGCDPCVAQVCAADAYCCSSDWDADCANEAASICGAKCGGSCGSVSEAGKCKGDVLEYCDGGSLSRADCASYGLACDFDSSSGEYDCL
jgi:hypothetical protein